MSYKGCENCGCRVYNGKCQNCHEIEYIEEQYLQEDMPCPQSIQDDAKASREERKRLKKIKETI